MMPDKDTLATQLQLLPNEIAAESTAILNLMTNLNRVSLRIDEIEIAMKFQVYTDKALTNDTARKSAFQDMLKQNADYDKHCLNRERYNEELGLTQIAHQRKRDMFNALIAIAGMK